MKRFAIYSITTVLSLLLFATITYAQNKVFLNNVDVTGLQNQRFENVNVYFDSLGNLHLSAPQYHVSVSNQAPAQNPSSLPQSPTYAPQTVTTTAAIANPSYPQTYPSAPQNYAPQNPQDPTPIHSYYVVAFNNSPSLLGFDIEVYVNGAHFHTIRQHKAQDVHDITPKLKRGENKIQYRLVLAASAGKSSKARVEVFVATRTGGAGNQLELSGEQGKLLIKGSDEAGKWYDTVINVE
ncbi:MAG: hypothetical protein WC966_06070 [Bradymonadales bacterium]|jgi:hypothetical protein